MLKKDQVEELIMRKYVETISTLNCFNDLYRYL